MVTHTGSTTEDELKGKPLAKEYGFASNEEAVNYIKKIIEERVAHGYSFAHEGKENDFLEKSGKKKQVEASNSKKEGELVSPKYSHGLPRMFMNNLTAVGGDADLNDEEMLAKRKKSVRKEEVLGMVQSVDMNRSSGESRKEQNGGQSEGKITDGRGACEDGVAEEDGVIRVVVSREGRKKEKKGSSQKKMERKGGLTDDSIINELERDDFHAMRIKEKLENCEDEKENKKEKNIKKKSGRGGKKDNRGNDQTVPSLEEEQEVTRFPASLDKDEVNPIKDEALMVPVFPFLPKLDYEHLYSTKKQTLNKDCYRYGSYYERLVTRSCIQPSFALSGTFFTEYYSIQCDSSILYIEYGLLENSDLVRRQLHICTDENDSQVLFAMMCEKIESLNFKRKDKSRVDTLSDSLISSMKSKNPGDIVEHGYKFGEIYENSLCISSENKDRDSGSKYVLTEIGGLTENQMQPSEEIRNLGDLVVEKEKREENIDKYVEACYKYVEEEGKGEQGKMVVVEEIQEEDDIGDQTQDDIHQMFDRYSHSNPLFEGLSHDNEDMSNIEVEFGDMRIIQEEMAERKKIHDDWKNGKPRAARSG